MRMVRFLRWVSALPFGVLSFVLIAVGMVLGRVANLLAPTPDGIVTVNGGRII